MYERADKYTPEEYWKLVEQFPSHKYEYVDGYVRMMTGGSVPHGEISLNIGAALREALRHSECHVYSSDVMVRLSEWRCYCPDVSVSCDPHDWTRTKAIEAPIVIVEVLSPSTRHIDTGEKLEAYRRFPTIQEILFADSYRRYVEHYHRLGQSRWEVTTYENEQDVIYLPAIEVSLSLSEIYFKVYLEQEELLEEDETL
ncbi:MAG: Uma2 family endonuclease [Ktedonobacteraceae bacterium]|nr:Uma2 family endonuclease [Ktedonobacteraceae bacterium]